MEENLQVLLQQADQLRDNIQKMHHESKQVNHNAVGIRESAEIIQKCLKKVGNNRMAALSNRDKRKVMDEMESAVEQLLEFID